MTKRSDEKQREIDSALLNLQRIIDVVPMVENQRNAIIHAIKVMKELAT